MLNGNHNEICVVYIEFQMDWVDKYIKQESQNQCFNSDVIFK